MTVKTGDIRIKVWRAGFLDWKWKVQDVTKMRDSYIKKGDAITMRRALKKARRAVPLSVEISS